MASCGDPRDWFRYGWRLEAYQRHWMEWGDARARRRDMSAGYEWDQILIIGPYGAGKTTLGIHETLKWFRKGHPVFSTPACLVGWRVEYDKIYADRAALYRTVPGIGPLTVAALVAHLPELGHWDSKALTSLVGLAPWSRDSGRSEGIGLSGVTGDWCGAPYTGVRGRSSSMTAKCVCFMTAFVIVGSRGTLQW